MKAVGIVKSTEKDYAYVEIIKKSACSSCEGCASKGKCHTELIFSESVKSYEIKARNHIGASVGDKVEVQSKGTISLMLAFMVFVLPVIVSIVSYFLFFKETEASKTALIMSVVFVTSFVIMVFVSNMFSKNVENSICKIIKESDI